MKNRVHIAQK